MRTMRASVALAATMLLIPTAAQARYAHRTLSAGSQGRDVKLFQRYLKRAGFHLKADGEYGRRTRIAERRFERRAGRRVDGRASRADQRVVRRIARRPSRPRGSGGVAYQAPGPNTGPTATIAPDGRTAVAPQSAPQPVKDVIAAANRIVTKPYRYGGGHGSFQDSAYDCSGSVSYALHGGGLLDAPLDSTSFERWGESGAGAWITVYANSGHAYVVIAGLRFDTSGSGHGESGPRWRDEPRSSHGYVARHPEGL